MGTSDTTRNKSETDKSDIWINELFSTKAAAFWRGYYKLTSQIDKEFEEYKRSRKGKRKKK